MHDLEKLQIFFDEHQSSESTSIIWIKVNNKRHLQSNIGFLGYEQLLTMVLDQIPSYGYYFDIKFKLMSEYFIIASKNLTKPHAKKYLNQLHNWFKKNNFLINQKHSFVNISSIILTDIPGKELDENLLAKAEKELLKSKNKIIHLGESKEDEHNSFVKQHIFESVEKNDFRWVYQEIISTQDLDQESYQLKLILNNSEASLSRSEYYETAKKTKLLKLFNTTLLNKAIMLIKDNTNAVEKVIVINQNISDYTSNDKLSSRASLLEQLNLPSSSLYFQLNLVDLEANAGLLKEFGVKLRAANIGICIADFNCSKKAWKIARKINTHVIKLKINFEPNPTPKYYQTTLELISQTFKKANMFGYKVFISKVDWNYFAADLWNLEVDYLQGDFIDVKELDNSSQSYC